MLVDTCMSKFIEDFIGSSKIIFNWLLQKDASYWTWQIASTPSIRRSFGPSQAAAAFAFEKFLEGGTH